MDNQPPPVPPASELKTEMMDVPDTDPLPSQYSVDVSIEPNHECEIIEIKYDGQEIYKEPLTHSEHLAQLISKIDFYSENNTEEEADTEAKKDESLTKDEITNARKFYQSLHETVKLSYDEVCVLLDCLSIARADKLMTLESERKHIISEEKPIDVSDKTLSLILKKKNIEKSKLLLKNFTEKIAKQENEFNGNRFHMELYMARQTWRIRKLGTKFNCDLSYRSVGCVNSMKAYFELIKTDQPYISKSENASKTQFLSVVIPEEFKENFFIKVEIVNSIKNTKRKNLFEKHFSLFCDSTKLDSKQQSWQETLEQAQNTIYCKEIYNQLLREVFDKKIMQDLRPVVTGNSIKMMITQEYDLIISLVNTEKSIKTLPEDACYDYDNAILEYFLHDLLKRYFEQNFFHYDQRPVTSAFAYNSHLKIAGMAYVNLNNEDESSIVNLPKSINHLLSRKKKINLLQAIKEKTEHLLIRKKVFGILNRICREIPEPHFFIEPCLWNNSTSTDIRVTISSNYYDTLSKSSFFILLKQSQVNVLNRSNNINLSFSDCLHNLRYYFIDQCCFHQTNLIISLSQLLGWNVVGSTFTNEQNTLIMRGTALLCNDEYKKKIAVKVPTVNQIEIYVFQYNTNTMNEYKDDELTDDAGTDEWVYIKENYVKVDIEDYPGFTQIQKYELFLAHFSTNQYIDI